MPETLCVGRAVVGVTSGNRVVTAYVHGVDEDPSLGTPPPWKLLLGLRLCQRLCRLIFAMKKCSRGPWLWSKLDTCGIAYTDVYIHMG